jgi:hypothetical protein
VSRRLLALVGLALLAAASLAVGASGAWFHSQSDSYVVVQAAHIHDWVHLYAQDTDPGGLTGYAIRRLSSPPTPAASGQDEAITVDLGGFPDKNRTYDFPRTITIMTPAVFPEAGVTQVTIAATLAPDPATGEQPLSRVRIGAVGDAGGAATVTMTAGQQMQVNVRVGAKKRFVLGQTYYPRVVLTLSFAGGPTGYFRYEIPMAVTDAGL